MLVLALDTSTPISSVGIVKDDNLIAQVRINTFESKHSERLVNSVNWLLSNLRISIDRFNLFAVVIGPGSFTSLRVGLATIKGFSFATGIPVVGVNTLDSHVYPFSIFNLPVVPVVAAKKDIFYTSIYKNNIPVFPPMALSYEDLLSELKNLGRFILVGPAVSQLEKRLKEVFKTNVLVPGCSSSADPVVIAKLATLHFKEHGPDDLYTLEPIYIKGVEIKLKGITEK